jgi:probable HAF family extracellular repeat protein
MPHRHALPISALLVFASVASAAAQSPIAYRVVDIGPFGGDVVGTAMNNHGDITGWMNPSHDGVAHAFRWTARDGIEDLGVNGGVSSVGYGINDNGDVVGVYFDQQYIEHPFLARRGDTMRDLSTIDGERVIDLHAISDDGRVAGSTWSGQAFRTLFSGALQKVAEYWSMAHALNNAGDVAGWVAHYVGNDLVQKAFRYSDAVGFEDLGTLGGTNSLPAAINSNGVVVGWSQTTPGSQLAQAFRARPGLPMENLGALPGAPVGGSSAFGINDDGDIVGFSDASWYQSAFRYTDAEGMIDLKPRIPIAAREAGILYAAFATNNAKQIGALYTGSGLKTWFLTPIYEPPVPVFLSLIVDPSDGVLSPPDGRMVPVRIFPVVQDGYDPAPSCRVEHVTNSEGPASGSDPDVEFIAPLTVNLRAKRLGTGPGRTYTLDVVCSTYLGGRSATQVVIRVPHDEGNP